MEKTKPGHGKSHRHAQAAEEPKGEDARRGFLLRMATLVASIACMVVPAVSGLAVWLDPLRRHKRKASGSPSNGTPPGYLAVASLDAIPADGVPRAFPVIADRHDAWTFEPRQRVGAVFLRRKAGADTVSCFTTRCPHAGCFVGYDADTQRYRCPCHASSFDVDGKVIAPSPSQRDMDALDAQVDAATRQVLVRYVNYYTGRADRKEKT